MKTKEKTIPKTLQLSTTLDIECIKNDDGTEKIPTFKMLANTGEPMDIAGFFDKVVIDLSGFSSLQIVPVLKDHGIEVGHTTIVKTNLHKHELRAEGILSVPNEESKQIAIASKNGFPWQASVGADIARGSFLEAGHTAIVNDKEFTGPLIIAHETIGKELTITKLGADSNTTSPPGTAAPLGIWSCIIGEPCLRIASFAPIVFIPYIVEFLVILLKV